MMVNCPRCGFSQEKDQYCAKCGVDMIAFRPAEKPLYQRIFKNTAFQLFVLTVVIISVFTFARRQHRRDVLAERLAEIESARTTQVLSRHTANITAKSEFASASSEKTAATPSARVDVAASQAQLGSGMAMVEAPKAAPVDEKPQANSVSKLASSAHIVFASVGKNSLLDLLSNTEPGPTIASGVVANFAAKMKSAQSSDGYALLDQSTRPIKLNQVIEFYGGQREETTGQFLGFVMELTPTQIDENDTNFQLRAWRYMRDNGSQVEEFSIPLPETFKVPTGGGVFIVGALPKRVLSEAERHFYEPLKVLNLLSTDDYRSGATDLVIYIEPK